MYRWSSYLAIGDSFTEGLEDPRPDGSYIGWADRLAAMIAAQNPNLRYGNLAVRGKMMQEILDEQLPLALEFHPDLVTLCAGGNDILLPGTDVEDVAAHFEHAVSKIRADGAEVVVFIGPDTKQTPVLRRVRHKVAVYNCHLWSIANRHDCKVVDLWGMQVLHDRRAWSPDRLHMSPLGHQRVALRTAELLGIPTEQAWDAPWPQQKPPNWLTLRRDDYNWTRTHLLPWVRRQLRGQSTGDGLRPKRPELSPLARTEQRADRVNTSPPSRDFGVVAFDGDSAECGHRG